MNEPKKSKSPDTIQIISYFIAAAIILPIAWWLKQNELFGFGDWVVSLFH